MIEFRPLPPEDCPNGLAAREHAEWLALPDDQAEMLMRRAEFWQRIYLLLLGFGGAMAIGLGALALAALFGAFA